MKPKHHFSCDGSLRLLTRHVKELIEAGDTASATADDGQIYLYRCKALRNNGAEWEELEPWTEERAKQFVEEADTFVVIG